MRKQFLLVFLSWIAVCFLGALPFYLTGYIPDFSDAVFESVSGFTTTGATVLADIEALPKWLLFWRSLTQWLGGMGIVILTASLLPLLKTEAPSPEIEKLSPRLSLTVRILWLSYASFTALQFLLLVIFGMDWFDAVTHSFSTISTGGFSVRGAGIAHFNSPAIEWICAIFMFLAGFNLSLIWLFVSGKTRLVTRNSEARAYTGIILICAGIITVTLIITGLPLGASVRQAFFHVASIISTTGFYSVNLSILPSVALGVLFFLMFIGGCSGSTAGGIKVIRFVILSKQWKNEMKRIIYPRGVFNISLDGKSGKKEVVYGVAGFIYLYFAVLFFTALLVSSSGVDVFTSLNTALLCQGNIGLGVGNMEVFSDFPSFVKWGLSLSMIIGRLELWTVIVLFTGDFWRK